MIFLVTRNYQNRRSAARMHEAHATTGLPYVKERAIG